MKQRGKEKKKTTTQILVNSKTHRSSNIGSLIKVWRRYNEKRGKKEKELGERNCTGTARGWRVFLEVLELLQNPLRGHGKRTEEDSRSIYEEKKEALQREKEREAPLERNKGGRENQTKLQIWLSKERDNNYTIEI